MSSAPYIRASTRFTEFENIEEYEIRILLEYCSADIRAQNIRPYSLIFSRKRATANMATSQQPAAHIQNHIQNYIRIFDDFSHIQNIRPGPVPAKLHKFGKKTTLYPNSRAFVNIRAYLAYPRHIRTIFKPCVFANVCAYPRHI